MSSEVHTNQDSLISADLDKIRLNIIDFIRGLAIINMVLYHLIYDLVYIYGFEIDWYKGSSGYYWQQYIAWSFIVVSGISMSFSKNNMLRGIKIMILAFLITTVTRIVIPYMSIEFGILHFIASGIIITSLIEIIVKKLKSSTGLLNKDFREFNSMIGVIILFAFFLIAKYFISSPVIILSRFVPLEEAVALIDSFREYNFMFIFGFPNYSFRSADYFPILPWIFLLWSGYFSGKLISSRVASIKKLDIKQNIVCRIGQNSLIIYMFHQIIIMLILYLIF